MIHYLIILRLHLVQIFQKYNIFLVLFIMKENMIHAISKSIHNLALAVNQNHLKAHCELGIIYYEGK